MVPYSPKVTDIRSDEAHAFVTGILNALALSIGSYALLAALWLVVG